MQLRTSEIAKRIFSFSSDSIGGSFGPLANRLKALRDYSRKLDQTDQAYSLLGSILTADSDVVSDDLLDLPIESSDIHDIYSLISDDTFTLIDEGLSDISNIVHNDDEINIPGDFVITDGDGISYKLRRTSDADHITWNMVYYDNNDQEATKIFLEKDLTGENPVQKINNVIYSMNNMKYCKTITAWLHSLSVTATLNNITNSIISLCVKGRANVTSVYSSVCQFVNSSITSVKQWAMTYINIFNEAGLSGVVNYILRSLHSIGTGLYDDDGAMAFTDNKLLIPQEFIGTMLATLATTIGTLLVAFGGIVVKIIGVALTVAGGVISWFSKTAWGQYNSETLAGLVDCDDLGEVTVLPESPYAICQFELSIDTATSSIADMLKENSGIVILDVPGGFLHVGFANSQSVIRLEFHAHAFWTFNDFNCDYFNAVAANSGTSTSSFFAVPRTDMRATHFENMWVNGYDVGATYVMTNNWSSNGAQVFDSSSDLKLRKVIIRNTGLFFLWLSSLNQHYSSVKNGLPITQATAAAPKYALQLDRGVESTGISWNGNFVNNFIIHALVPFSGTVNWVDGATGQVTGSTQVTIPSWTTLGTSISNNNALSQIDPNYIIGLDFPGNNVIADYYISSGVWYPQYGNSFLTANPSELSGQAPFSMKNALVRACNNDRFMGDADFVSSNISSGVYVPKYNRETYWLWVGAVAAATVIIAATVVIASLKIRKAIIKKRASNATKVESAWANLVENPNDQQAQEAYYKAAKRANLWAKVIGGTTFDTSNYWSGGSTSEEPKENVLSNYIAGEPSMQPLQETVSDDSVKLSTIKNLIYRF